MKPGQNKAPTIAVGIAGGMVAVWLGIALAPGASSGLRGMLSALTNALNDPLRFHIVTDTPRCVLVCLFLYGLAVLLFVSSGMNFRRGEEYGSAKWGSPRAINRKYRDRKNPNANLIMTQHVAIGSSQESMYRHRRNLNTVVIGGSGSGKSTSHVLINLLQASQDVREYKEVVYFGMTLRQLIFSALAVGAALGVYLLCGRRMSMEAVSWLCVAAAIPFAAFGFVRWHGMAFEQLIVVFIRSRLVLNRPLFFRPDNPYKAVITSYQKEKGKVSKCSKAKRN